MFYAILCLSYNDNYFMFNFTPHKSILYVNKNFWIFMIPVSAFRKISIPILIKI